MILRAIELTVRLVRAFYVRACVCTVPVPSALSVLQLLDDTRLARTHNTTQSKGSAAAAAAASSTSSSVSAGLGAGGGGDRMIGPTLPPSMVVEKDTTPLDHINHNDENGHGTPDYHQDPVEGVFGRGSQVAQVGVDATTTVGSDSKNGQLLLAVANGHANESPLATTTAGLQSTASEPGLPSSDDDAVPPLLQEVDLEMTAISDLLGKEWGNGVVPPGSSMGDKVWALLSLRVKAIDAAAVQSASVALLTLVQGEETTYPNPNPNPTLTQP